MKSHHQQTIDKWASMMMQLVDDMQEMERTHLLNTYREKLAHHTSEMSSMVEGLSRMRARDENWRPDLQKNIIDVILLMENKVQSLRTLIKLMEE